MMTTSRAVAYLLCTILAFVLTSADRPTLLYGTSGNLPGRTSSLYLIDALTGATSLIGPILAQGKNVTVNGMTYDTTTSTMFIHTNYWSVNYPNTLMTVNLKTAIATVIGASFAVAADHTQQVSTLAMDSNSGILYAFSDYDLALVSVDKATGLASRIGSFDAINAVNKYALVFDKKDTLYLINNYAKEMYTIDPSTGVVSDDLGGFSGRAINTAQGDVLPGTSFLYAAEDSGSRIQIFDLRNPFNAVGKILTTKVPYLTTLAFVPTDVCPSSLCSDSTKFSVYKYTTLSPNPCRAMCVRQALLSLYWALGYSCGTCPN